MRDIATGDQFKYYLVGTNDQRTTEKINLNCIEFDGRNNIGVENYLAWIKKMTRAGYAVTITVYMNYYLFYGNVDPNAGEYNYDHIVSVSKVESQYDDDLYHPGDLLVMSDHGLWAPRTTGPVYLFNYTFKDFPATRQDANTKVAGKVYSLPISSHTTCFNYGISHTGVIDANNETLPIDMATSVNYESPEIQVHSEARPKPMALVLTTTVRQLEANRNYVLYKYNSETSVPTSDFNSQASMASTATRFTCCTYSDSGVFKDNTFTVTETILSDQKVIYRAVRSDAH